MGWIGRKDQVIHYLGTMNADRDAEGKFLLVGPEGREPVTFMGDKSDDADVVVPDEVCYLVAGHQCALAAGLGTTSYGMSVTVI